MSTVVLTTINNFNTLYIHFWIFIYMKYHGLLITSEYYCCVSHLIKIKQSFHLHAVYTYIYTYTHPNMCHLQHQAIKYFGLYMLFNYLRIFSLSLAWIVRSKLPFRNHFYCNHLIETPNFAHNTFPIIAS